MEQIIRFRQGTDSLNDKEIHELINCCIQYFDQKYFIHILFNYFVTTFKNDDIQTINNEISNIQKINGFIKNIIVSRNNQKYFHGTESMNEIRQFIKTNHLGIKTIGKGRTKLNIVNDINNLVLNNNNNNNNELIDDSEVKLIKLNDLSSSSMSLISSFLDFSNLLNFERTSRAIFMGTRSPISLYKLEGGYLSCCIKNSNLYRFKSIKELNIREDKKPACDVSNALLWSNLQQLQVTHFELGIIYVQIPFNQLTNVNTIRCVTDMLERTIVRDIFSLLNYSDKLKYIELDGVSDGMPHDSFLESSNNAWDNLFKLKGLALTCDGLVIDKMLTGIGEELQSLHLQNKKVFDYRPCGSLNLYRRVERTKQHTFSKECKFNNLKEICLNSESKDNIDILNEKKLLFLKRIHFDTTRYNFESITHSHFESINELFSLHSINYIGIVVNNDKMMLKILKILQCTVNAQDNKERLKIVFMSTVDHHIQNENINKICNNILILMNFLNQNCKHFMLIFHNIYIGPFEEENRKLKLLLNKERDRFLINFYDSEFLGINKFVVSNKECTINGYREKWIMPCKRCSLVEI